MDGLLLALDQAAAYIKVQGCSLQHYLDLYEQYRQPLLDMCQSTSHPESVLMTFWLSCEQIRTQNSLADQALQYCAFFAPDPIPDAFIQTCIELAEEGTALDALELDQALGLLHRYSLIERVQGFLSLHRLVQEVIREVLASDERQVWMERATFVVNANFPDGAYGTWDQYELLLPHALICAEWVKILRPQPLEAGRLLNAVGRYLYERGQFSEAEPLLLRALEVLAGASLVRIEVEFVYPLYSKEEERLKRRS
jgi:hypothetical protein